MNSPFIRRLRRLLSISKRRLFSNGATSDSRIKITLGVGATSCFSTRLQGALAFYDRTGEFPAEIDSTDQFKIYRDKDGQDVSRSVFGDYRPDNTLTYIPYKHDWQFRWYDDIEITDLSKLSRNICPLSPHIIEKAREMSARVAGRTAILYRGNDKALEIPRTQYEFVTAMAKDTGSQSFLLQTDEEELYEYFKESYPDTVFFSELPRIRKNPDAHVMPTENRVQFLCDFLSALLAISKADKLVTNTGNTGIWTTLFRGHTKNVWQFHGFERTWRKLKG